MLKLIAAAVLAVTWLVNIQEAGGALSARGAAASGSCHGAAPASKRRRRHAVNAARTAGSRFGGRRLAMRRLLRDQRPADRLSSLRSRGRLSVLRRPPSALPNLQDQVPPDSPVLQLSGLLACDFLAGA